MNNNEHILNDISKMYPYGEFPSHYTKKQKNPDLNNPHVFNYYTDEKYEQQNSSPKETYQNKEESSNHTLFDLKNAMPILTSIMSGKKLNNNDLFSSLIPLLIGNKSKEITPLLKLFLNKNKEPNTSTTANTTQNSPLPPSEYNNISSYERV